LELSAAQFIERDGFSCTRVFLNDVQAINGKIKLIFARVLNEKKIGRRALKRKAR
jgi:hypothetical protein